MKYLIITTYFLVSCSPKLYSQCDISTPLESTINEFNWQQQTFELYVKEDNSEIVQVTAPSPFHAANGSAQGNTDFLTFPAVKDYQVEDGWELLFVNFGTSDLGVAEPSFALYNRYDGMVRTFVWLTANEGTAFNSALLKIRPYPALDSKNSALFENINSPANALDNFDKKLSIERHNSYAEGVGTWIIAGFATAYDPCTCFHTTGFQIYPVLVSVSTITLTIEGTSITTPLMSGSSSSNQAGFIEAIGSINSAFQDVATITGKGQKTYKTLKFLADELEDILAGLVTPTNNTLVGAIPNFLNAIPYIGTGLQVLDFLVGGGKKSSSSTVTSFMERHHYNVTGVGKTIAPYQGVWYYTPSSDRSGFDESKRIPVYDNVLGVANVLKTPVINTYSNEISFDVEYDDVLGDYVYTFKKELIFQLGDIQYIVNENAGISSIPKEATGYLIFQSCKGNQEDAGLIRTVLPNEWRTPELPLGCLLEYQVIFQVDETDEGLKGSPCERVKVKLKLILDRSPSSSEADDIIFMQTYIPQFTSLEGKPEGDNPFANIKPEEIDGKPLGELGCEFIPPVARGKIKRFCKEEYNPKVDKLISENTTGDALENNPLEVKIYPNPTNSILFVEHEFEVSQYVIMDIMGRVVLQGHVGLLDRGINLSNLVEGYYFLKIWDKEHSAIQKSFVKQ